MSLIDHAKGEFRTAVLQEPAAKMAHAARVCGQSKWAQDQLLGRVEG